MLCAIGRVGKIERKIVVFIVYIPPNTRAAELEALGEAISAEVTAIKSSTKNPVLILAGDFNHRDISDTVGLAEDITLINTGPTRGANVIDRIYTNIPDCVTERLVLSPLQASSGTYSDHRCVYASATLKPSKKFKWKVKMRRTRNKEREESFANDMKNFDWSGLRAEGSSDGMWHVMERTVAELTEKHFPLVRVRKRSNESPWITRNIRRLWKKKISIYKKEGCCHAWWNTDHILQYKIESSRAEFVEKMLEEGNWGWGKSFYAATKKLAKAAVVPQWSIQDLFVGKQPQDMCQEILGYLGSIASEATAPVTAPTKCHGGLPKFTIERTTELLKATTKTDSRVDCDPLAHLVRCYPTAFAVPVAATYNEIKKSGEWPAQWKTEHLTVIPKNPNPSDLSECCNISCTSIFSKLPEREVLLQLRKELLAGPCQYGGVPKCGVEHLLVDLWENVLLEMEGGDQAAVLLGVDYEKAFNRMDHGECRRQLAKLGASTGSLSLVGAFLKGRTMTISIDDHKAKPVPITKGSPQGSVLGCLLYCVTTQLLTKDIRRREMVGRNLESGSFHRTVQTKRG